MSRILNPVTAFLDFLIFNVECLHFSHIKNKLILNFDSPVTTSLQLVEFDPSELKATHSNVPLSSG